VAKEIVTAAEGRSGKRVPGRRRSPLVAAGRPAGSPQGQTSSTAATGFEASSGFTANKCATNGRGRYSTLVLGLDLLQIFSDSFEELASAASAGVGDRGGANRKGPRRIPRRKRCSGLRTRARGSRGGPWQKARSASSCLRRMVASSAKPTPQGVLRGYRPAGLDKQRLGELSM